MKQFPMKDLLCNSKGSYEDSCGFRMMADLFIQPHFKFLLCCEGFF